MKSEMKGTLTTVEDYEKQSMYHQGSADALTKVIDLYSDEISEQMQSYLKGERVVHREQAIKCLDIVLKMLKEKL